MSKLFETILNEGYFIDKVFDDLRGYLDKLNSERKISFGPWYDEYDIPSAREKGEKFRIEDSYSIYDSDICIEDSHGKTAIRIPIGDVYVEDDEETAYKAAFDKVMPFAQEILDKINNTVDPHEGEPRFNVYVTSESLDMTDGEPRLESVTEEECIKYCKKVWKEFKAGKFDPWGYGALDPDEDDYLIDCSCCNGMTEDKFGAASWGKLAGKFTDYPEDVANGKFDS